MQSVTVPGSAVPRSSTAARVVADNGSRPTVTQSASRRSESAEYRPTDRAEDVHGLHDHVLTSTTVDTIEANDSYVPYVHITTGERRPLRVHVDQHGSYHPLVHLFLSASSQKCSSSVA